MIDIVRIKMNCSGDYIFSVDQWRAEGGYKGLIKSGAVMIRDVEKVVYGDKMSYNKFTQLPAWEG